MRCNCKPSTRCTATSHLCHISHDVSERKPVACSCTLPRSSRRGANGTVGGSIGHTPFGVITAATPARNASVSSKLVLTLASQGRQELSHLQQVLQDQAGELAVSGPDLRNEGEDGIFIDLQRFDRFLTAILEYPAPTIPYTISVIKERFQTTSMFALSAKQLSFRVERARSHLTGVTVATCRCIQKWRDTKIKNRPCTPLEQLPKGG